MAFVAEVKAKLGLDTTDFQRGLTKTTADVGKAGADMGKKLNRAFGAGDVFKGLLQGLGIGSVQQITDMIVAPFQIASERAQNLLNVTGKLREITQKEIGVKGGPVAEKREMIRNIRDISQEIEIQQKLVNELNDSPLKWVNAAHMQMLSEAEKSLGDLKVEQASLQGQLNINNTLQKRATEDWVARAGVEEKLTEIELRKGSEREKLLLKSNALQKEYIRLARRGQAETAAGRDKMLEWWKTLGQLKVLDKNAREERLKTLISIGQGIVVNPRPIPKRGRSETERIADRGARYAAMAQDAVLKGDGFGAKQFSGWAARDLGKAGERIGKASSSVDDKVAKALGNPIISAAKSLKEIEKNLAPSKIQ